MHGDGLPEGGDPGARRVLVVPVADRLGGRLEHGGGAVEVGEALAEVDRAGPRGQRRHLREDRGPEAPHPGDERGRRVGQHPRQSTQ